jgi:hypothetical protein
MEKSFAFLGVPGSTFLAETENSAWKYPVQGVEPPLLKRFIPVECKKQNLKSICGFGCCPQRNW